MWEHQRGLRREHQGQGPCRLHESTVRATYYTFETIKGKEDCWTGWIRFDRLLSGQVSSGSACTSCESSEVTS